MRDSVSVREKERDREIEKESGMKREREERKRGREERKREGRDSGGEGRRVQRKRRSGIKGDESEWDKVWNLGERDRQRRKEVNRKENSLTYRERDNRSRKARYE